MPFCTKHPSIALEPKKRGWYCEECDQSVLSYEQHPRPDATSIAAPAPAPASALVGAPSSAISVTTLDLEALPFPVAYPLAWAHDAGQAPALRLGNAIFAAYQAMRTTTLLLLADYLDVAEADRGVDEAIRGLRMPHWAEWTDLERRSG